jgi:hypothetical protein
MFKMINYLQDEDRFYHEDYYDMKYMKRFEDKLFNYRTVPADLLFKISVSACHKFYLASFIKDINATFPVNVINEDNPFFYQVLFEANRFYLVDDYYYNRRRRKNSITTLNDSFLITSIKTAEHIYKVFLDNGLYELYKKQVLNKVIYTMKYKYEVISEEFKEEFYNECMEFLNRNMDSELYIDLIENITPNNKKFIIKLFYSSDYEEFNQLYNM